MIKAQHADLRAYVNPRNGKIEVKACPDCGAFEGYEKKIECDASRPNPIIKMGWLPRNVVINFPQ